MTRTEAHTLLNAAKAGYPVDGRQILDALRATGDLGGGMKAGTPQRMPALRWAFNRAARS